MEAPANVSHDVGDLAALDWSIDAAVLVAAAAGATDVTPEATDLTPDATDLTPDATGIAAEAAGIVAAATARPATAPQRPATATEPPDAGEPLALSPVHRAMLDFERQWWRQPGAKEQAIRDRFEMSPTRYYQALNALLDAPAALSYDPALVGRLRRLRSTGARGRRVG